MTKETQFENIEMLNKILSQYHANGSVKFSHEDKLLMKETFQSIMGTGQIMDLSCPSCCLFYLTTLTSYYEREYPIYLAGLPPVVVVDVPVIDVPVEPVIVIDVPIIDDVPVPVIVYEPEPIAEVKVIEYRKKYKKR